MGLAKSALIESQERGWDAPEKFVCASCVEDEFLKNCIQENSVNSECDYCSNKSDIPMAAPVESIMEPISHALYSNFADPVSAGVPSDEGDWVASTTDTQGALLSIPFDCHYDLFDDVMSSFHNQEWVECANGSWLEQHDSTKWRWDWENFERKIKTRTRYFFSSTEPDESEYLDEYPSPSDLLRHIGIMAKRLDLFEELPTGTCLFRVREIKSDEVIDTFTQLGPPPSDKAGAGRMNPAGISYFYLAREKRTAIGEVLNRPPCQAALATFVSKYDMVFLDLAELPDFPSVFDVSKREQLQTIIFLNGFVKAISQPIAKDGREHVDYVPSQVVSEYFAKVFLDKDIVRVDGIIYPSAVVPDGQNIVIFPLGNSHKVEWEKMFDMMKVERFVVEDWEAFLNYF